MVETVWESRATRWMLVAGTAALAGVFLYLVGLDQGDALSLVQGDFARDQNLLHEFFHDVRHAAGFPCH
ncbi:MAG: CbtB-domain containing protein [Chloroflexi bacterium]|nr:CbtB-domain containing protein [Betaproteobacteria bacterium]MBI4213305.1 CbtB-domain containing protein [Chloroflexota bacterium]